MFTFRMIKKIIIVLQLVSLSLIYAGQTGKIAGKILDSETNEPLIGVNILIVGSSMGAATDLNGEYFIINVPPGVYSVKASAIGFRPVIINNIRVSVDKTSKIDFKLGQDTIELGDVLVTAVKPIVKKDLTSTESIVSGDQIALLPIEDLESVVNLQAGVMNGHFRGGRSNEVKYLIDGVSVNDVFTGENTLSAEVNSLEEVQVLVGTFNAEYGEALSGVVNQITKIAGDKIDGNISFYGGDYVTNRSDIYTNVGDISPTGIRNIQGLISGPIPGTNNLLKMFISGRYFYNDGYLYGQRMFNPSDSSNFSANDPDNWYVGATGDNAYVPMNWDERMTLQGKLSVAVGQGKGIVFNSLYQKKDFQNYDHNYKLNPDGDYKRFQESFLLSASYTHVFNNAMFVDVLASGFKTGNKRYVFENPLDPGYVNPERERDAGAHSFLTGGTKNWHFDHKTTTYTGKIDFTYQVNQVHQIKTGADYKSHNLDYKDYQILVDASTGYKPAIPEEGAFNSNIYIANPYQFSIYAQDKIELEYLVVNFGLRFDYFEPGAKYLIDPDNIAVLDEMIPPFPDSLFADASVKSQFSPRIGLSYPITDKGAIHISYGHFFQVPQFEYLYANPNFRIPLQGSYPDNIGTAIGNADLEPQQTIMYELGLQQEIMPMVGFTLTAYYKDIRNLLGTELHVKNETKKFSKFINRDYGTVQGISVSFEKIFDENFGATVDYTFQVAKGNASDPNDAYNNAQASPPIEENKQLVPLDWDRRHQMNFTLTLGEVGNYIISSVGTFGTGLPYTPALQNQRTGLENSDNRPTYFNVDLFLTKYFKVFNNSSLSIYLKVYNLFDIANEVDVFSDTGRAGTTLELTRSQEAPRGVNTMEEFYTRPDFYSAPRQILFGVSFSL